MAPDKAPLDHQSAQGAQPKTPEAEAPAWMVAPASKRQVGVGWIQISSSSIDGSLCLQLPPPTNLSAWASGGACKLVVLLPGVGCSLRSRFVVREGWTRCAQRMCAITPSGTIVVPTAAVARSPNAGKTAALRVAIAPHHQDFVRSQRRTNGGLLGQRQNLLCQCRIPSCGA